MMDRRDFLRLAGASGFAVATTPMIGEAIAAGDMSMGNDEEPLFAEGSDKLVCHVHASGGWEPTLLCDPKGDLNNTYDEPMILEAGNIRYAPIGAEADAFFNNHFQSLLCINGINWQTNSHDAGQRHGGSGYLPEGYPCLAALAAGFVAPYLPLAFLSFGGYTRTSGLVATTANLSTNKVAELAHPDRFNFTQENSPTYHTPQAHAMIRLARESRTQRMMAQTRLPRYINSMDKLITARLGADQLKALEDRLPEPAPTGDQQRIQLMVAAMAAGICVSGNFSNGGFDTHSDHDQNHPARLRTLLSNVDFMMNEAITQGIEDRFVAVVSSDFGRTPTYNDGNGKDHWSTTSMMLLGAGVPGNRVVGVSDDGHNAQYYNEDMELVEDPESDDTATYIHPMHVHKDIRRLLCIDGSDVDEMFPLHIEKKLRLFNPQN